MLKNSAAEDLAINNMERTHENKIKSEYSQPER